MQNLTTSQSTKETVSKISSKGQVTVPVEVRKHLGVDTNGKLAFVIESDGKVRVSPAKFPDIKSLSGAAGKLKKPLSKEDLISTAREDRLKAKYDK